MSLELADIAIAIGYLLLVFAGGVVGGFLANLFYGFFGYNNISDRILSVENSLRGSKGVTARAEKEGRMGLAIAEAAKLMKEGKQPLEVLQEVGPKYPDVALDLYKKFKKDGLEGLF